MRRLFALRCLLPVLAVMGMLVAPLAAPAAGEAMSMADDMPCCPDGKPAMPDCGKSCPLATVCMAKCFQNFPTNAGTAILSLTEIGLIVPLNDVRGTTLAQAPPARPPRT